MTRDKQMKTIRQFLKELGVTGIKLVDCNTIHNTNEKYKDHFIASGINTIFLCTDIKTDSKLEYCVEYENQYIYFNSSIYMQYAIKDYKATPQSNIKIKKVA